MSVTASDLQNLVIASLANAEPTALERLQTNVPLYWALHARKAHLPELRYWYVRREAIRLCMACNTRAVDYLRRTQNAQRASVETSRQDSSMNAASEENSNSTADRAADSVFDSEGDSTASGSGVSTRSGTQSASSSSSFADIGTGVSTQNRRMHQDTYTNEEGNVLRHDTAQYDLRHKRGKDSGDGTTRDLNVVQETGYAIDINPFDGSVLPSQSATTTTIMTTSTRSQVSDRVYAAAAGPSSISQPFRERQTTVTLTKTPKRTVDSELYDRPVDNAASTTPSTYSSFTANLTSSESANSSSSMTGSASSASQSQSDSSGNGESSATGSSESSMVASATRTAAGDGEAQRSHSSQVQMNSLMEKLHQRFLHLQELWKSANEMIDWFESQRLALPAYVIQTITIQYPAGVTADVANQYLAQSPAQGRLLR